MKKFLTSLMLSVCLLAVGAQAQQTSGTSAPTTPAAQQPSAGISPNGVIGEVTVIDGVAKQLTVKTDTGSVVAVLLDDKTIYKRVPPGETNLKNATDIVMTDVAVGDRVFARGRVADDQKSVPARQVIVMTKADLAQKHERDRAEWQRRGVLGVVSALNPATKEITINMRGREGTQPVVIAATDTTQFRRYAPDSIKFDDAKSSTLAELKVGDQLRALGERSPDGARFTPQEVVSGTFRTLLGTVTAVDAAHNQLTIKNEQKQLLTVVIGQDSSLRRVPEMMAQMMAMRGQGGGGMMAGGGGGGGNRPEGQGRPAGQPAAGGTPPQGGEQGGAGAGQRRMGGPGGGGGFDMQGMLESLPATTLADLKPGDVLIVSSTVGADPTRLTAINVIAGADTLLAMMGPRQQQQGPAGQGLGTGMPAGLDFGIGLP